MLRHPALRSRTVTIKITYWSLRHAASKSKAKQTEDKPPLWKQRYQPLIRIVQGTFYRTYPTSTTVDPTNPPLFPKLDFTLESRIAQWPEGPRGNSVSTIQKHKRRVRDEQKIQDEQGPHHWAVIGSESTTFLNILRGQYIAVPPRSRLYPFLRSRKFRPEDPRKRNPHHAIQYVGFSGEGSQATGGTRGAYLSARYESLREETDWSVRQYLKGQTELNPLEDEEAGLSHDDTHFHQVVDNLKLRELLDMPVSNLSNGQTRRTRIAKALLTKPELLLLDEPFMGLDPATTDSISSLLRDFALRSSPRVLLSLRPQDSIPDWISHVLILNGDTVAYKGPKQTFLKIAATLCEKPSTKIEGSYELRPLFAKGGLFALQNFSLPNDTKSETDGNRKDQRQKMKQRTPISLTGEPIIEMDGVYVQYGEKVVLGDWKQEVLGEDSQKQGLQWKVRRSQRWAVLGANGSGKTTLLSVITSDHPQAYALPVRMFGRSRLPEPGKPGISIFDLQSRMGHSSPEVHAFFPRQLSVRAAIESAWADTFLAKPILTYECDAVVDRVLEHFKPELDTHFEDPVDEGLDFSFMPEGFQQKILAESYEVTKRPGPRPKAGRDSQRSPQHSIEYADVLTFGQLTVAQQRLVLFLRAIIKKQELIILDEAFSGMPAHMRDKCFSLLNNTGSPEVEESGKISESQTHFQHPLPYLGPEQALIVVSHLREEIPDTVRFWMRLPSEVGDDKKLQFALGVVPDGTTLSTDENAWKTIWSENALANASIESPADSESSPTDAEVYRYVTPRRA